MLQPPTATFAYILPLKRLDNKENEPIDIVREIGFDITYQLDSGEIQEKIFFIGSYQIDGPNRSYHATPEAIHEFIEYWENQIEVAKGYIKNNMNNITTEWNDE